MICSASRRRRLRHCRRSIGFTLVELLVVIGIIALLISILLPALGKARESANQVKCQAQQRQILQGMMLHANDRQGFMPLAGLIWTPNFGTGPADVNDARQQHYVYYQVGNTQHITSLAVGVAKYLGQDLDLSTRANMEKGMLSGIVRKIFVCPSDREGGRYGVTVNDGGSHHSSYAFNEAALGYSNLGGAGADGSVHGHSRYRGNTARFPHPSQLMLLTDAAPRGGDGPASWMLYDDHDTDCTLGDVWRAKGSPKQASDPALFDKSRHRGRIVIGFADGHVDNIRLAEGDLDKISLDLDFH
jgi:prepilin-type N-terminal cleavage/methylation domain-containing protein/prepilin-type processing-associated H-X9-DG protein